MDFADRGQVKGPGAEPGHVQIAAKRRQNEGRKVVGHNMEGGGPGQTQTQRNLVTPLLHPYNEICKKKTPQFMYSYN